MTFSEENWDLMLLEVSKRFSVTADFDFLLFLIGIHERGQGMIDYSREEKMDLINLAKCTLLSRKGYLKRVNSDVDGWPQFEELKSVRGLSPSFSNDLFKRAAFEYLHERLQ
jgi:hypothetical protein